MFIQESHFPLMMKALLLYATLTTCSSVEYFIIPSRTSSCISTSCLTFQQFITNFSNYQEKKMILRFGPGNHLFHSKLNVTNVDTLSIMSNSTENFINCSKSAGFIFSNVMTISLTNLSFNGCGKPSRNNVVIKVSNSSISIKNCIFNNSKGRIIELEFSKLVMSKSMFNRSKEGVFIVQKNSTMHDIGSIYELSKSPTKYSAIVYISGSLAKFSKCSFLKTTINGLTDMIYTNNLSSIILEYCEFVNNIIVKSRSTNKYLVQLRCSTIKLDGTVFKQNILHSGKLVYVIHSNISINNSVFEQNSLSNTGVLKLYMSSGHIFHNLQITRNSAKIGILRFYQSYVQIYDNLVITQNKVNRAVMLIDQSKVEVYQNIIIKKNHAFLSTIDIYKSTLWFCGNIMFISNYGSIFIEESLVSLETSTFFDNVQTKQNKTYTTLYELGGAITSIWSVLHLNGRTEFCENHSWKIGGAINAIQSKVYIHSAALFTDNTAKKGGAIYLDHSDLICQNECSFVGNRATSRGGAIHATDSLISIGKEWYEYQQRSNHDNSLLRFVNNSAKNGGGLSFEAKSKLHGPLQANYKYVIEFNNNTAVKGGAIYVDDYTNVDTCGNTSYSTCFLQTPFFGSDSKWNGSIIIKSKMDTNTIYGGLLDRCVAKSDYVDIYKTKSYKKGVDYLKIITKDQTIDRMITSDPIRLCFCHDGLKDCDSEHPPVKTEIGKTFHVALTVVDQMNHTLNATVYVDFESDDIHLGKKQRKQKISSQCSNLTLNIYSSSKKSAVLILYAIGPCKNLGISQKRLQVDFLNCTCPIGFQLLDEAKDTCQCDCNTYIKPYINLCYQSNMSLIRQGDFWITYINNTIYNDNPYIVYPNCPYDYCLSSIEYVNINLNIPNGSDAQCASNRSGLLCSICRSTLSLSIGSSLCLQCPSDWPKLFILIILGALLSGIIMVIAILILNLTVAVGTLNGLIFYGNIVASIGIPLQNSSIFSIFIAWLNLELGLDICFFKGLDTYSKVWIQFAFPTYLIAVLFMVIIMSKYSSRFAKLIGKRNPVATLATLILLSYMKYLRNIVHIFSIAILTYPDGSHQIRWLPDANIEYLHGKHVPLFLIATVIVAIGLIYTVLLLTWQWLLQAPNYKVLRWIRNTRLNLFMEANMAAYISKHRYWTGLLLLIRVAFYLEIAYNTSNEVNASLLATGLIAACLLLLKAYRGKIYKKGMIDCLDTFTYFNLLILSIAQLYSQHNKIGQMISAKISVSAAFLQLLFVLIYHMANTFLEIFCQNRLSHAHRLQKLSKPGKLLPLNSKATELMIQVKTTGVTPTSTEIGLSDSEEASVAEYGKEKDTSGRVSQSLTTKWEDTNSLHEPLLQEEL